MAVSSPPTGEEKERLKQRLQRARRKIREEEEAHREKLEKLRKKSKDKSQREQSRIAQLREQRRGADQDEFNKQLSQRGIGEEGHLTQQQLESVEQNTPRKPGFPVTIFAFAVLVDLSDMPTAGTLGPVTSLIMIAVLRIWFATKGTGPVQQYLWKKRMHMLVRRGVFESIPLLNWIPLWSMFVRGVHKDEVEYIDKLLESLEQTAQQL